MYRLWSATRVPVIGFLAALALACSGTAEPTAPVGTTPERPAEATGGPDSSAATPIPDGEYDPTQNMYRLFSGEGHNPNDTLEAIGLAVTNEDRSMVPVMIEMLRFFGTRQLLVETTTALSTITGQTFGDASGTWNQWMEWLGQNADAYGPPDGYVEWKITLMTLIDPRFADFLRPAEQGSRINVFEIAWGGVRPDGIPDLQNAPVVPATAQDYLLPTDRVFGVSINGEHRAYPLRIVNAHEMANDVLGGEPIALAY